MEDIIEDVVNEDEIVNEGTVLGSASDEGDAGSDKTEDVSDDFAYEVVLDEGMEIDKGLLDLMTPKFQAMNATQEQVQELAEVFAGHLKEQAEVQRKAGEDQLAKVQSEWKQELLTELGPDAEKQLAVAAKAIDKLSPDPKAFRDLIDASGIGNNIHLARLLINVGKMVSEDTFVDPNKTSTGGKADINVLYPSMTK